ncbi:lasso peptide biosynthesis B2 protein [Saccharothrix sp. NRRL B-16348]|uniref:lasso peptide biosynthesis B2 protein n=1 Tax=Saccharothrix sp. NRRL B-16348 TaxID=1415542 RepID=UPI0006AE5A2F|nr:lasso peptide biosynthesis B2 protein [Saccharothrix sp. NRRL B-16348]
MGSPMQAQAAERIVMAIRLGIPEHVQDVSQPTGGGVLLDLNSGRCYAMNPTAYELWREWHRSGDFDLGFQAVADRDPDYCGERFRSDSRRLADDLLRKGLLITVPEVSRRPGGVVRVVVRCSESVGSELSGLALVALLVMPLALLLVRMPFRLTVWLTGWLREYWCCGEATPEQALSAILATRSTTRYHPGRIACLELSLGAVLILAVRRRHLSLVIGVADNPCRFHAWVETKGGPLGYPTDADIAEFRPICTL